MTREAFLSRVRQAAQVGRAYRVHLSELPEVVGYVGAGEVDICRAMADEVNAVGGTAHFVEGHDAAREQVLDLLDSYRANSVLMWRHDVLQRMQLRSVLDDADVGVLDYERMQTMDSTAARRAFLAADVGITSCDIAVAETGSLIVCSTAGQERIASLVTPVHIAIVERDQIVPDLFDAFAKLGELGFDAIPSNISIITGPSKTGDIELTLTTGVHGPGKWHVVIVR